MSSIEMKGFDEMLNDIEKVLEKMPQKRKVFHEEAGKVILAKVVKNTPHDSESEDGSHLKDALYSKVGSKGGYVAVKADYTGKVTGHRAPHAHLVENGHVMIGHKPDKKILNLKSGGTFVKGKHMFEKGMQQSKKDLTEMAEQFANEIAGEFK